jgi:hypothetical protein
MVITFLLPLESVCDSDLAAHAALQPRALLLLFSRNYSFHGRSGGVWPLITEEVHVVRALLRAGLLNAQKTFIYRSGLSSITPSFLTVPIIPVKGHVVVWRESGGAACAAFLLAAVTV